MKEILYNGEARDIYVYVDARHVAQVVRFLEKCEDDIRKKAIRLIKFLGDREEILNKRKLRKLKGVNNLYELKVDAIRIVFCFVGKDAVLIYAMKKTKKSEFNEILKRLQKRAKEVCDEI